MHYHKMKVHVRQNVHKFAKIVFGLGNLVASIYWVHAQAYSVIEKYSLQICKVPRSDSYLKFYGSEVFIL